MKKNMIKAYSDLIRIHDYHDRYEYLKIGGKIGKETFGKDRYINQIFYSSKEWKQIRDKVIIRDNGNDLGDPDYPISGRVVVHHINPITREEILNRDPKIFDLENLICVSHNTHEAIHFGDAELLPKKYVPRKPYDTCPWRCVKDG